MMERNQKTVTQVQEKKIKEEVKNDKLKGLINQALGMLLALSAFAGVAGYQLEWLSKDLIDSFGILLYSIAGFAYTAYTIYKNWYTGKQAQKQNEVLKETGLKK